VTDIAPHRLSDQDMLQALALIKQADSVELKLTVPNAQRRSLVTSLDIDPIEAQIRQVFFFDTPDLTLDRAGVVLRARRVQGRGDDTVVKLRPVVPGDLPAHLRSNPEMVVEVDAMPGGYMCSASLKGAERSGTREVAAGRESIHKLFTKGQRAFYEAHAPEGIGLDDLSVLGPVTVFKLKFEPADFDRRIVAELWFYPDGSQVIELSTKCAPAEALEVALQSRAYLVDKGVDLDAAQTTKTRTALEFFTRELAAGGA
jgi:hypothetical protein